MTEPALTPEEVEDIAPPPAIDLLPEYLAEMARLSAAEAELHKERDEIQQRAIPLLKQLGSYVMPVNGTLKAFNVRAAEKLKVDAGELLKALVAYYQDEDKARLIWEDTLKPPAVDTKEGGLFHQQCAARRIPEEVIAQVAKYETAAEFIGSSKIGG